ncbi:MAG: hypothetical protein RR361_02155, partial [Anaerovorax sp.]
IQPQLLENKDPSSSLLPIMIDATFFSSSCFPQLASPSFYAKTQSQATYKSTLLHGLQLFPQLFQSLSSMANSVFFFCSQL